MSATVRRAYVDTRVGQLHVARAGRGPAIVMLPAASQSHHAMRQLAEELSSTFETIVIDTPGSGYSDPLPESVSFALLADAVADAIRACGLARPCVYGIHTGNKIAASLAARHHETISALVFCGQTHSLIADHATRTRHMRQVSSNRVQANPQDAGAARQRERLALWREIESMWWRDSDAVSAPVAPLEATRLAIADLLLSVESLPRLYEANFAYDLESDLRRIRVPTLIIEIVTALEDGMIGRQGPSLLKLIENARLLSVEEPDGLGLTLENRAEAVAAAIREFLMRPEGISSPAVLAKGSQA